MPHLHQTKIGPRHYVRWRGLLNSEETKIVERWRWRRRKKTRLNQEDYIALVRAVQHAVISKIVQGKLHIVTPED